MDIERVELDSGGDNSRCQTHRVYSALGNSFKILNKTNCKELLAANVPKSRKTTSHTNCHAVIVHRPIRTVNQLPPEVITSTRSVENVAVNNACDKAFYHNICKTHSESQIQKPDSIRSVTKKSCWLNVCDPDESDDDMTIRNSTLTLSRNGLYEGDETLRLSLTSLCSQDTIEEVRKEAFQIWLQQKEKERKEKLKRTSENKSLVEKKISDEQRKEIFDKWLEKKRLIIEAEKTIQSQQLHKEAEMNRQKLLEQDAKLQEWVKRKEEDRKESKRRERELSEKIAREKDKKKHENQLTYEQWLLDSRNKPLPVPLNQGILSMRGSISAMYINPEPWRDPTKDNSNIMPSY